MATISNALFSPLASPSSLSPPRALTVSVSLSSSRFLSVRSNPPSTSISRRRYRRHSHRKEFPFLVVDGVIDYSPGISAVAIKNVTMNDNSFPRHFPERPIMPFLLMVEVGGLVMLQPEVEGSHENFFFAGIDEVRGELVFKGEFLMAMSSE